MINKQNLWFLTLFSLILVLSVYYITMPNDLLATAPEKKTEEKKTAKKTKETIEETSSLVAMRVSLEEERQNEMDALQEQLTSDAISSEEKNNAYEKLKYLNEIQGKEESLEKKIKKEYNIDCFVKIDNSNASAVCVSSKHDGNLANNIMRLIQGEYKNKMYITVKFQKNQLGKSIQQTFLFSQNTLGDKKMTSSILTAREKSVFELLIDNMSTKEIANELGISEKTVRNHISNVMQKLGVNGRAGAVVELLRLKELSL